MEEALIKRLIKRLNEPDEGRFAAVIEKRTGSFIGTVSIALHHDQINDESHINYFLNGGGWDMGKK
ncbi:hypothetical protein JCM19038_1445 [Geomicrobium sp. JCM 19038]|nr:hypothetical protein JCM19038_1445 [Geomicrobium sp. JCM 19038]